MYGEKNMKCLGTLLGISATLAGAAVICRGLMALYRRKSRKRGR